MGLTAAKRPGFVGSRFGRLTVMEQAGLTPSKHLLVRCRCDCGKEKVVRWGCLHRGATQSCGCWVRERVKDITGHTFGYLTVIERSGSDEKCRALWKCRCVCGSFTILPGLLLRNGNTASCGCLSRERSRENIVKAYRACTKPKGEASFKVLLRQYQRNARFRGVEWDISDLDFRDLVISDCDYCGRVPSQLSGNDKHNGRFLYNGIDRLDSTRGYTISNVVPCCKWCNWIKGKHSVSQFYENVARIALRHPEILKIHKVEVA